jgi:hypothetical protein
MNWLNCEYGQAKCVAASLPGGYGRRFLNIEPLFPSFLVMGGTETDE